MKKLIFYRKKNFFYRTFNLLPFKSITKSTYAVQPSDALVFCNLVDAVDHALVRLGGIKCCCTRETVLKTQPETKKLSS